MSNNLSNVNRLKSMLEEVYEFSGVNKFLSLSDGENIFPVKEAIKTIKYFYFVHTHVILPDSKMPLSDIDTSLGGRIDIYGMSTNVGDIFLYEISTWESMEYGPVERKNVFLSNQQLNTNDRIILKKEKLEYLTIALFLEELKLKGLLGKGKEFPKLPYEASYYAHAYSEIE